MIARGARAQPAVRRLRACVATAAATILAACSQPAPLTEFAGGIAIPAGAVDLREQVDDGFRSMTAYYRFELPPQQLPALTVALRCSLGEAGTAQGLAHTGEPPWFAADPSHLRRGCQSRLASGWFYQLEVDISRPERYTVYLIAFS